MRCIVFVLSVLVFFTACVSTKIPHYHFNKKQAASALQQDIILLKKILEANHPSLYWHTPKDTIDYYFNEAITALKDSTNEIQFKNIVAKVVAKIKCGHTSVRYSKQFLKESEKHNYPQFPLYLKVWDDSLIVLSNAFRKDTILKRGTIITSINGRNNRHLLDTLFMFMSTDGNSNNFKNQVLSNNFPAWYKQVFGLDSIYTIDYIDAVGKPKTTTLKNYSLPSKQSPSKKDSIIKKDTVKKPIEVVIKPTRKQIRRARLLEKRSLQIDTSINTAYIRLNTFSSGRLRHFFRKSMRTIQRDSIKNVVIDLRSNGGGSVGITKRFLQYFVDTAFKHGDTVAAVTRSFPYRKHIKGWQWYWFPMNFFAKKQADGLIHYRRYEQHYYKPRAKYHFKGNVYLVQGGITFSAATMFISTLKNQKNVTVVGEETGGGYYGNTAMHLPTIVLPNSKLRIILPMYKLVMNKNRPKGNGIIPNVLVPPSSAAILDGYDIKLYTIRKMILNAQQHNQ
jgi:C-terminal processing protease CtpA/Prc